MAKLATLTDDFEDGSINPSLWVPDAGVTETGGQLVVTPALSLQHCITVNTYDATESSIVIHIPTVTPVGTSGTLACGAILRLDPNNQVGFVKGGSNLICQKQVAGVNSAVSTFAYNAATQSYWRLRESGGIFFWDTGFDGVNWTPRFSTFVATNLFPLSSIKFYVYAVYSGAEASPGTVRLSSVNLGLQITSAGISTSTGSARLFVTHAITASAASTSDGSANLQIHAASVFSLSAAGTSTSSGTALIFKLSPGQLAGSAQSFSAGSAAFAIQTSITATGQSFSIGTATLSTLTPAPDASITQYFYFEPPIAYDLPPTLPHPRPKYLNAHARWKGGQRRGRSVLKLNGVYVTIDTPTVDQTLAASEVYMGGHIYTINNITADALVAAGYVVTPIPINWTLYPDENVYPEANLFPGYQELIPDQVAV